jgi:hypothetical protein
MKFIDEPGHCAGAVVSENAGDLAELVAERRRAANDDGGLRSERFCRRRGRRETLRDVRRLKREEAPKITSYQTIVNKEVIGGGAQSRTGDLALMRRPL